MKALGWGIALVVAGALAAFLLRRDADDTTQEPPAIDRPETPTPAPPEEAALRGRPDALVPATPGTTPEAPETGSGLVVTGDLVDPQEQPASGARVAIEVPEVGTFAGVADGEGRFRVALSGDAPQAYVMALLRATLGDAASLYQPISLPRKAFESSDPYDVGTLSLQPATPLTVHVVLPPGAGPPATVWINGSGWWDAARSSLAHGSTDADGNVRFERVPHGAWRVLAAAEGAGRGEVFVSLPRSEGTDVEIVLPAERVVKITVTDRDGAAPIAGARLTLYETVRSPQGNFQSRCFQPRDVPPTDESGVTVLRGMPPEGWFEVGAEADGYPPVPRSGGADGIGWARIPSEATEVAVTLVKGRVIRWPIAAGEVPVPDDGTRVALKPAPGSVLREVPASGTVSAGALEVADCPPTYFHGMAELPDGALARLYAPLDAEVGPTIRFTRPRRIVVTLTRPDGTPATGYYVKVANQGNNPLADPTLVDEEGRAAIDGLYADAERKTLVEVRVAQDAQPWGGFTVASVDISEGDREVTGVVPRMRPVTIRIRRDGEVGLPAGTKVHAGLMGANPGLVVGVSSTFATAEQVDLETGEVHVDWQPAPGQQEGYVTVALVGYVPYAEKFEIPGGADPLHFEVDLHAAGAIAVHVKVPEDGRTRINLQRWDGEKEAWTGVFLSQMAMGGYARPDANGDLRLEPLEAGRYRVIDSMNEATSEAVEVRAGGEAPRVVLDVSKSGFVRGRVEVPEGCDPNAVRVLGEGLEGFSNRWSGLRGDTTEGAISRCDEKGDFWLRVPGDRDVTLRPEATGLQPAAEGGTRTVRAPCEGIVLRLVPGRVARVGFAKPLTPSGYGFPTSRGAAVRLYRGKAQGDPVATLQGDLEDEGRRLAFSGFEPGTWTVWIDAEPFVPVVLEGVKLGEGETDLGEVAVEDGASVVVEVVLPTDHDMPRMYAWVSKESEPTYARRANGASGTTLTVRGLGTGTFRVRVGSQMGQGLGLEKTVTLDGKEEVRLTLDARR